MDGCMRACAYSQLDRLPAQGVGMHLAMLARKAQTDSLNPKPRDLRSSEKELKGASKNQKPES